MGTTVTVKPVTEPDALFCKYPGQFHPQGVELYLDTRDGEVGCEYNPNVGGGTTMAHFHRLILSAPIPCLTAEAANALMADVAPLAQRVLDGADEEWNGSNHVGTYTADALAAWDEIVEACAEENFEQSDLVSEWAVEDWFTEGDDATIDSLGITTDTTDERLAEIAAEQVEMATTVSSDAGYAVLDQRAVEEHLTRLRDGLRETVREELEGIAARLDTLLEERDEQIRRIKAWGAETDTLRSLGALAGVSHTEIRRILAGE